MPGGQNAFKRISMLDHFSQINSLPKQLEKLYIRGPLVIGLSLSEIELDEEDEENEEKVVYKTEFLYDYEEEKMIKVDLNKKLDPKEMNLLIPHVLFQPSLG